MAFKISINKLGKSICYRIVSSSITVIVSYIVTKNFRLGLSIGALDLLFKIINYYTFDTVWEMIFKKKISPSVIWLTGLSGSGKTSIANELINNFKKNATPYVLLDGNEIRNAIKETGYDFHSTRKHNLNVAYMASLFERQGNVVIVCLISPYREVREECRMLCRNFIEVFIDTPVEVCEERDPKGLYRRARGGELENFTGIHRLYEKSESNEITIYTPTETIQSGAKMIYTFIKKRKKQK